MLWQLAGSSSGTALALGIRSPAWLAPLATGADLLSVLAGFLIGAGVVLALTQSMPGLFGMVSHRRAVEGSRSLSMKIVGELREIESACRIDPAPPAPIRMRRAEENSRAMPEKEAA